MGTTERQGPSKRIRIVLCMLVVLGVTAAVAGVRLRRDPDVGPSSAELVELEASDDRRPLYGGAAILVLE